MCLLFLALSPPRSPGSVAILHNRDEFFDRPTSSASWIDRNGVRILAPVDQRAGGTWIAFSDENKFAVLTNVLDPSDGAVVGVPTSTRSRGEIPFDFLTSGSSPEAFCRELEAIDPEYDGYNVFLGAYEVDTEGNGVWSVWYHSNRIVQNPSTQKQTRTRSKKRKVVTESQTLQLKDGMVYGISNGVLGEYWPKVDEGIEELSLAVNSSYLHSHDVDVDVNNKNEVASYFSVLLKEQQPRDSYLPDTGIDEVLKRAFAARFCLADIRGSPYGTRTSVVAVLRPRCTEKSVYVERNYPPTDPRTVCTSEFIHEW